MGALHSFTSWQIMSVHYWSPRTLELCQKVQRLINQSGQRTSLHPRQNSKTILRKTWRHKVLINSGSPHILHCPALGLKFIIIPFRCIFLSGTRLTDSTFGVFPIGKMRLVDNFRLCMLYIHVSMFVHTFKELKSNIHFHIADPLAGFPAVHVGHSPGPPHSDHDHRLLCNLQEAPLLVQLQSLPQQVDGQSELKMSANGSNMSWPVKFL